MKQYLNQLFSHATHAHQQGDYKTAESTYKQILRDFPGHPDATHFLGLIYSQKGDHINGIEYIKKAIAANPKNPVFHNNLGEAYRRQGNSKQALKCFEKATEVDPNFANGYFGQANLLKSDGNIQRVLDLYQRTIDLQPNHTEAYYNLGNTMMELGNYKSAIKIYQKLLAINSKHAEGHNNLAIALNEWDRTDEAIQHYHEAIKLNYQFIDAHQNLGMLFEKRGETDRAKKYYQNVKALSPADLLNDLAIVSVSPVIFKSNEEIDQYRSELNKNFNQYKGISINPAHLHKRNINTLSNLIYQGRDDLVLKKQFATLFNNSFPVIKPSLKEGKPHVGFVVTNGHEGVFIKCMAGILNNIDMERFKVTVVCSLPNGEKILRPAIKNSAIHFLSIPKRFDHAAEIILKGQFDILHYWEIGTDFTNYFLPFLRLAPVQCTSWGWPVTSAIPNVDYFISSEGLETTDSDNHYTEKLVKLKKLPVYYYKPEHVVAQKQLNEYGLPTDKHIYLCSQNLRKVHPDFDQLVEGILEGDPDGMVLFINDKQPQITTLLEKRLQTTVGNIYERICFMPRMKEQDYLNLLKLSHVALDTLYYCGGANTSYDAFAMGTPVITLPGKYHRSRYTYAAYRQMDITDCIAENEQDYIDKAIKIATDDKFRIKLSKKISQNSNFLFEDIEVVQELMDFFDMCHQAS